LLEYESYSKELWYSKENLEAFLKLLKDSFPLEKNNPSFQLPSAKRNFNTFPES